MLGSVVGLCVMASAAAAQDGAVARIISAQYGAAYSAEIEVQVLKGHFYTKTAVDVLDATGRMTGTLTLPAGVDMLMPGDRVKVSIVTKGPFPLSGALVAETGKYATHAAALKATAGAGAGSATPAPPAAGGAPPAAPRAANVKACPYTAAELQQALGLDLLEGAASQPMPFAGGTSLSCRYAGRHPGSPSFTFNQIVMNDPAQASPDTHFAQMAGRMQAVPGDPDKAMWQANQGDLTNATLHYARNGVIVEARVSVRPSDPAFQSLRERLAKLRRVP